MAKKNSNRNSNGRSNYSNRDRKDNNRARVRRSSDSSYDGANNGTPHDGMNDVSWYAKSPTMLNSSASYSFANPVGNKFNLVGDTYDATTSVAKLTDTWKNQVFPGVMRLTYRPIPGLSTNGASPINVSAKNLYAYVRHVNSGHANYDPTDLMIYLLAMDSVFSFYTYMQRCYGILNSTWTTNRYVPAGLALGSGINYDDFKANLADFKYYLNNYAQRASAMYVPNTMKVFIRHSWMNQNIYTDSESKKSQFYVFQPSGFYTFVETEQGKAGYLKFVPLTVGAQGMTFAQMQEYGENMLQALLNSEDIGIISGDILKAYKDKVYGIALTPSDYQVKPVYNPEVLNQIHNATIIPDVTDETDDITQAGTINNYLIYDPVVSTDVKTLPAYTLSHLLDMRKDEPTPEDNMVASRLMVSLTVKDKSKGTSKIASCGTELVTHATIITFQSTGMGWIPTATSTHRSVRMLELDSANTANPELAATAVADWVEYNNQMSVFDWSPFVRCLISAGTGISSVHDAGSLGDACNYTVLSSQDLDKMHTTAIMSLYDVPFNMNE